MNTPINTFLVGLLHSYANDEATSSRHAARELGFVGLYLIENTDKDTLESSQTMSIERAVTLAIKMGVSFDPSLKLASLRSHCDPTNGSEEYILILSLNGLLDAFSRVNGMTIDKLSVITNEALSVRGDVMSNTHSLPLPEREQAESVPRGAVCVIKLAGGDSLPTTMNEAEVKEIAQLAGIEGSISHDFIKYHIIKRAIKTLVSPVNSQLSLLQQAKSTSTQGL